MNTYRDKFRVFNGISEVESEFTIFNARFSLGFHSQMIGLCLLISSVLLIKFGFNSWALLLETLLLTITLALILRVIKLRNISRGYLNENIQSRLIRKAKRESIYFNFDFPYKDFDKEFINT